MKDAYKKAQQFMKENWVDGLMYQERVNLLKLLIENTWQSGYADGYSDCFNEDDLDMQEKTVTTGHRPASRDPGYKNRAKEKVRPTKDVADLSIRCPRCGYSANYPICTKCGQAIPAKPLI